MVVRCLRRLQGLGRMPKAIRSDNGTEFKGREYIAWAKAGSVQPVHIQGSIPTENVLVERFNLTMRQEVLDRYFLTSVPEAVECWRTGASVTTGQAPPIFRQPLRSSIRR